MKIKVNLARWIPSLLLATATTWNAPAATLTPRTDINPALLYWQAFGLLPELTDAENSLIRQEDAEVGTPESAQLAARFNDSMKMLRRATQMRVPCDWGVDLADGPEALMPNLIKVRTTAYAAIFRARHFLENGQPGEARRDLMAALTLARLTGRDATLVSTMIGISMETLVQEFLAKNLHRFPPETLPDLERDLHAAQPRSTVENAMRFEKAAFLDWMIERITKARTRQGADDAGAMKEIQTLLNQVLDGAETEDSDVSKLIRASGGTSSGMLEYFKQAAPIYDQITPLTTAAPENLSSEIDRFTRLKESQTNLIAQLLLPNVGKARSKELEVMAGDAIVRAALAYHLKGVTGLNTVPDPFAKAPLAFRRLDLSPGTPGFELKSKLEEFGLKGTMAFQEIDESPRKAIQRKDNGNNADFE